MGREGGEGRGRGAAELLGRFSLSVLAGADYAVVRRTDSPFATPSAPHQLLQTLNPTFDGADMLTAAFCTVQLSHDPTHQLRPSTEARGEGHKGPASEG